MSEFKIGKKVKVLDKGGTYTTYKSFFKENNLEEFESRYISQNGELPIEGKKYNLVGKGKHEWKKINLILVIEDPHTKQIYLIEEDRECVEPVKKFKVGKIIEVLDDGGSYTSYDDFFEINNLQQLKDKYSYESLEVGSLYKIVAKGKHECGDKILAVEGIDSQIYLTGIKDRWIKLAD